MKKLRLTASVLLIIVFIFSGSLGASAADNGAYFDAMLQFIRGMYYQDMTDEEGLTAALKGMFEGLDKYSTFYDNEETETLNNSLSGSFVGIGAGLEKSGSFVKVVKVYADSPAEKIGILEGDVIVAVDGVSVENKDAESVASIIRGSEGTSVKVTVKRGSAEKVFTIVRGKITVNPVMYRIEGKIAYIHIDSFISGTGAKFSEAIDEINKRNIVKIILDLRGNPGGYVEEAVAVARRLIPPGVITTLDYKSEEMTDRVYATEQKNPDYIVSVLVDENTASASEILAGALEDAGIGILIGQKTFGKGIFQNLFTVLTPEAYEKYNQQYGANFVTDVHWMSYYGVIPEKDEILGTVKLTTGHYLTPNGRSVNGIGLLPVVTVPNRVNPNGVDLSKIGSLLNAASMVIDLYSSEVYNAESVLKAAGYFSAVPDKKYDSATMVAVKKYQEKTRLPITGIIDLRTRDELNKTFNDLRSKNDLQYKKAMEILNIFSDK